MTTCTKSAAQRRRGACPGLSAPMPTGDGLLVRFHPVGTMALTAFGEIAAAAREYGSGIIEISARGSVQVRGLTTASAPHFADAIAALGIAAADGVPVLSNALAGLDAEETLDAGTLAADLRRALARTSLAAGLAPKVSVVIDGGGALSLDGTSADIRLHATSINGARALVVGVGGDDRNAMVLGVIAPANAVEAAARLLEVVARHGRAARARDVLSTESVAPFATALADLLLISARPRGRRDPEPDTRRRGHERRTDPVGLHRLRDGSLACGLGLAFGHTDAATLEGLTESAAASGAIGMRAAPGRALMIIGLSPQTYSSFVAAAERLGFIVRADDPRRHVVACAGAPVCASASIAARAIAPLVADAAAPVIDRSFMIHISGCAKGCAHPATAALTAVGTAGGCALIANGSARDAPFATVAAHDLPGAIARHAYNAKREIDHV